jgi:hypothetical protein
MGLTLSLDLDLLMTFSESFGLFGAIGMKVHVEL